MNKLGIFSVLLVLLLVGCSSQSNSQPAQNANTGTTGYAVAGSPNTAASTSDQNAGLSNAPVKEFTMTAKDWEFDPSTITVNKGDRVIIHVKSLDVQHSLALPDFGINQDLQPGQEETVDFIADKTGTYDFHCAVFCGAGHRQMKGQLIVQ